MLLLLACAGPGDTDTAQAPSAPLDPATVPLAGSCPMETGYGGLSVVVESDATSLDGQVADSILPTNVREELTAEGDCRVLRRDNPHCDPDCDPGYTCDLEQTCVAYPANQDLGTVTVDGLDAEVEMEATFPGNTYYDTSLPHPAYTTGVVLTLSMPGGAYGPAELHGVGVEPFEMDEQTWILYESADMAIGWPAPSTDVVRSEIAVSLSIDQHGVTPSTLECVFEDDGEGTVPASTIAALVSVGVTGFPTGSITRRTVDNAPAGEGCMEFGVRATRTVPVDVVGYTPCVSQADCPEGQTCDLEFQVCE